MRVQITQGPCTYDGTETVSFDTIGNDILTSIYYAIQEFKCEHPYDEFDYILVSDLVMNALNRISDHPALGMQMRNNARRKTIFGIPVQVVDKRPIDDYYINLVEA